MFIPTVTIFKTVCLNLSQLINIKTQDIVGKKLKNIIIAYRKDRLMYNTAE